MKKLVESGQLSIFNKGYWGHPAMKLPPAVNLLAVAHYLEVLDFQREVVRIHTILGGKNPHPNYLVGGVACPINVHDTGAQGTMVNEVTLNYMRQVAQHAIDVVANVYIPDIKAIASFYPDWFKYGKGLAGINMLSYGDFPKSLTTILTSRFRFPAAPFSTATSTKSLMLTRAIPSRFRNLLTTPGTSIRKPTKVCIRGTALLTSTTNSRREATVRKRSSTGSLRTASIPGSRARAGEVT